MRSSNHAVLIICLTATFILISGAPIFAQQSLQFSAGDYVETGDYWLQEIDRTGDERWFGPVRASAARETWTPRLTQNRPTRCGRQRR